jgi:hypothetical protein
MSTPVMRATALLGLSIALAAGGRPAAHAATTPLTLVEEGDVARADAPARAAVPLSPGALRDPTGTVDGPGGPRPTQSRVLARWADGSIRWLDVRFTAAIGAGERQDLRFESGVAPPAPAQPVTVAEHDDRIDLATGALRFSVRKDRFDPLANLIYDDGKPFTGPLALYVRQTPGAGGEAEAPRQVRVAERGPLTAAVTMSGRHRGGFLYELALRIFAGEALVELTYTFTNATDPLYTDVREIGMALPLTRAPARRYLAGSDRARPLVGRLIAAEDAFTLAQESEARFVATPRAGTRAAGWLDLAASRRGVLLAAADFWQEYPKALRATRDRLVYDLWPGDAPRAAHLGTGVAKSQTIRLRFHDGRLPNAAIATLAADTAAPLLALPPPAAVAATGALDNLPAPGAATTAVLELVGRSFDRYAKIVAQERWNDARTTDCSDPPTPRTGYYGMLNWGDWNFPKYMDRAEGCDGWGNLEYDLPQVLGVALLASGNRAYRPFFEAAARHYRDVDVLHYSRAHPQWVGMNHPHKALHFDLSEPVHFDLGHTWAEGLFTHYYLSGDARSLAVGRGIADQLARRAGVNPNANARQLGWPAIALVAAFRASGERRYLAAAEAYARAGRERFAPSPLGTDWKLGVLADGLSYVHAETGDPALAAWLLAYADALAAASPPPTDLRYYPALAYAAHLEGRSAHRAAARAALDAPRLGYWGKPFAANGRAVLRRASLLALTPRRAAATPPAGPSPADAASADATPPAARPSGTPPGHRPVPSGARRDRARPGAR